ncbi:MAG: DUF6273 domain-containing protein, partial [Oscillospiraceae bacterium]|nr:DUF6273 domain-containing protein [Oscillospiraceae bacterium]
AGPFSDANDNGQEYFIGTGDARFDTSGDGTGTPVGHNAHPEDLKLYDTGSGLSVDKPETDPPEPVDITDPAFQSAFKVVAFADAAGEITLWNTSTEQWEAPPYTRYALVIALDGNAAGNASWPNINNRNAFHTAVPSYNTWWNSIPEAVRNAAVVPANITDNSGSEAYLADWLEIDASTDISKPTEAKANPNNAAFALSAKEVAMWGGYAGVLEGSNAVTQAGVYWWLRSLKSATVAWRINDLGSITSDNPDTEIWYARPAMWIAIAGEPSYEQVVGSGRKVDGGDGSMWTEIAVNGGYSLIVRDNNIKAKNFCIHTAAGQGCDTGCTDYLNSVAKTEIDDWYAEVQSTTELAPIVLHAVGNDATENLGSFRLGVNMDTDDSGSGISAPVIGNPATPFLLSLEEVSKYCCRGYYNGNTWTDRQIANDQAYQNWDSLADKDKNSGWWLRSPNFRTNENVGRVANSGHAYDAGNAPWNSRGLRPALWVDSSIFAETEDIIYVPDNTTIRLDGIDWIKIKSDGDYALLLLKEYPNIDTTFGSSKIYEGSNLQAKMTAFYKTTVRSSPKLYANTVIPVLNGSAATSLSEPTATLAAEEESQEIDVCFALSKQEAFDISGTYGANPIRAYSFFWWLRSESTFSSVCRVLANGNCNDDYSASYSAAVRPALWVKVVGTPPTEGNNAPASRVLPAEKAGDTSDWIEIATNGSYSLILRSERIMYAVPFCTHNGGSSCDPEVCPIYEGGTAQSEINSWFNGKNGTPIYKKAVTNDVMDQIGQYVADGTTVTKNSEGISSPSGTFANGAANTAFLLSYQEAVMYCSTEFYNGSAYVPNTNTHASDNWNLLADKSTPSTAWWLRTPYLPPGVRVINSNGRVQSDTVYPATSYGLRPAIWVDSSIFDPIAGNIQPASRLLTAAKAGDDSDWIEIATNENYSLILRANCIQEVSRYCIHVPFVDSCPMVINCTKYSLSKARTVVNTWYKGKKGADIYTKAVKNNVMSQMGVYEADWTLINENSAGISAPTSTLANGAADTAFLLSHPEAVLYCNPWTQQTPGSGTLNLVSATVPASGNWHMLQDRGDNENPYHSWFLRTPRTDTFYLQHNTGVTYNGRPDKTLMLQFANGLRPAIWVDSSIFD